MEKRNEGRKEERKEGHGVTAISSRKTRKQKTTKQTISVELTLAQSFPNFSTSFFRFIAAASRMAYTAIHIMNKKK